MRNTVCSAALLLGVFAGNASGLAMAPQEFTASRQLACVLAQESLGYLDETQYGARVHSLLDGFEDSERDTILSKALGYVDGLMFAVDTDDTLEVNQRLEHFVTSGACESSSYQRVTLSL